MRSILSSRRFGFVFVALLLGLGPAVVAQEVTDAGSKGIEIADGVHLLAGLACNVIAVIAPDGVLIIDNGRASGSEDLEKSITELDAGPVRIVLDTHFHFDHIGANEALARDGAVIVAHENVRRRMLAEWRVPDTLGISYPTVAPYPEVALPILTITDSLTVHFGGHEIEVRYLPSAHSDADVAVFLRDANILHIGDLYLSNGFPIIDSYHGGTIDGLIAAVDALIDLIDDDTKVVPGHGPVSNRRELREYRHMLAAGRDRITALIDEGKTLEEVVAADPTAGLYRRGESWLPPKLFVWMVYVDLTRSRSPAEDTSG